MVPSVEDAVSGCLSPIRRLPYFSRMGRLSDADLRGAMAFVASVPLGTAAAPIPPTALVALRDLLHADEAEYFELGRADRRVIASAISHETFDAPGSGEAMHAYGHENPLNWRRWTPASGSLRLSERVRRSDFARTGFYDAFMRPNRLHDGLKVWLSSSDESVSCVQLWRDHDFTRREQNVLGVLHHHLIEMRLRALAGIGGRRSVAGLTVREAEVLTWAARGASDAEIGRRLGISAATVRTHVEHVLGTLRVHSRAEAISWLLFPDGGH